MYEPVEKTQENKSQSLTNAVSQRQKSNAPTSRFVDTRPEAIQMRRLRDLTKSSPQNAKLRHLHHLAAAHSVAQKKSNGIQGIGFVDNRSEAIAQRKLQEMGNNIPQAKQNVQLQAKADNYSARLQQQPIQKKASPEPRRNTRNQDQQFQDAGDQGLQGGFLNIYQVSEQNEHQIEGTTLAFIRSTLIALQIIDNNAEVIAAAQNPRTKAMELTNIGIEDGFNPGESADHIRANARMIVSNFPEGREEQVAFINQTLRRGDPCLTARMEMIQNHIAEREIGEVEVEGEPDLGLSMQIYELWNDALETNPSIQWQNFVQTLPREITNHANFIASLRNAREAATV